MPFTLLLVLIVGLVFIFVSLNVVIKKKIKRVNKSFYVGRDQPQNNLKTRVPSMKFFEVRD